MNPKESYDKHKDALPEATIERIKGILQELNIELQGELMQSAAQAYSICLYSVKHRAYVNGKGTQESYCLASAYGEAMERIQNGYFYNKGHLSAAARKYGGFYRWPQEKLLNITEAAELAPCVYEEMRVCYLAGLKAEGITRQPAKEEVLRFWQNYLHTSQISCVDFYRVRDGQCVLLPEQLISSLCGSNGLCAGNTPEEAIAQGICEALERYVKYQIMHKQLTMPDVPRTYLRELVPELVNVIEDIESRGSYSVYIKDASLGQNYPVLCVLLVDTEKQRYHVKFGAHCSLAIALERCLTELLQGYQLGTDQGDSAYLTPWTRARQSEWCLPENQRNMIRSDVGVMPDACLAGTPSWAFAAWPLKLAALSNAEALRYLTELIFARGFELYVRDNSYLGFPAYRVYIPGLTVTRLPYSYLTIREQKIVTALEGLAEKADFLAQDQLEAVLDYMEHCKNEWRRLDYGAAIPREAVTAAVCLKLGRHLDAAAYLRQITGKTRLFWNCAARELELTADGVTAEQKDALLTLFFGEEALGWTKEYWRPEKAAEFTFAKLCACSPENNEQEKLHKKRREKEEIYHKELDALHMQLKDKMLQKMPEQAALNKVFYFFKKNNK